MNPNHTYECIGFSSDIADDEKPILFSLYVMDQLDIIEREAYQDSEKLADLPLDPGRFRADALTKLIRSYEDAPASIIVTREKLFLARCALNRPHGLTK